MPLERFEVRELFRKPHSILKIPAAIRAPWSTVGVRSSSRSDGPMLVGVMKTLRRSRKHISRQIIDFEKSCKHSKTEENFCVFYVGWMLI